jgi:hypothetical protein
MLTFVFWFSPVPDSSLKDLSRFQPAVEPQPDWSEVEGEDYPTYISNLRKKGCPESTLQQIVAAEIQKNYGVRYPSATPAERKQILQEQKAMLAALFSPQSGVVAAPGSGSTVNPPPAEMEIPAQMPLVLQPVDLKTLELTPVQAKAADQVQQKFVQEIGGLQQNPSDPAYFQRWQDAQVVADEELRAALGDDKFNLYQIQATQLASTAPASQP